MRSKAGTPWRAKARSTIRADEQSSPQDKAKELHDVIIKHEASKMTDATETKKTADVDETPPASPSGDASGAAILEALKALTIQIAALAPAATKGEDVQEGAPLTTADSAPRRVEDVRANDAAMSNAQARADAVHQAFSRRAPPPMSGESLRMYRLRLLRDLQPQSKVYAKFDLHKVDGAEFDTIESQIFADAMSSSKNPVVPAGELIERIHIDSSGRRISTFYGSPKDWMRPFMSPGLHGQMTIRTKFD